MSHNGFRVAFYHAFRKNIPTGKNLAEIPSTSEASQFADQGSTDVKLIANEAVGAAGLKAWDNDSPKPLEARSNVFHKVKKYSGNKHQTIIGAGNVVGKTLLSFLVPLSFRTFENLRKSKEDGLRVLKSINELSKVILELQGCSGLETGLLAKLNESKHLVVKGAIACCYQRKRSVIIRCIEAQFHLEKLEQLGREIDDMSRMLLLLISTTSTLKGVQSNLVVSPLIVPTLNNDAALGINEQIEEAIQHPGWENDSTTTAVVVYDIGEFGKNSLGEEDVPIHTNLSTDEIIYIKSSCHESHLIGKGSFARVYRGIFQGKDLAIKKIEHRSYDTKKWMENEVKLLQGIEHKNINMLYAWCIEARISYLVYMYISGWSLEDYLRGNCRGFVYSWTQCFKMIIGIAEGIEFLHKKEIIHVDIKPQNIMVNASDNEVKLVDFGFSRKADWEGTHQSTDKIIGTKGYWAPEYCFNHRLSFKQDVFSFGIVVLEMITGERHVDSARGSSQFHIPGYVSHMISNDRFEEAVDPRLKQKGWNSVALTNASSVANIALQCVRLDRAARPFMDTVVRELTSIMMNSSDNITTVT